MGLFSKIKDLAGDVFSPITKSWDVIKDVGKGTWSKLSDLLPEDLNSIDDVWKAGKDFLGGEGGGISSAFQLAGTKYGYDKQLEGIKAQNATAAELAHKANALSQRQAERQMQFQKTMSQTAHQREIKDLRKAGLNPILSGTGGMGASTPSGAQGNVQVAPVRSEGDAISSAFQAMTAIANAMKTNADREYVQTTQTPNTQAQTRNLEAINTQITQSTNKILQETKNLEETERLTQSQREKVDQEIENLKEQFKHLKMIGEVSETEYAKLMEMAKRATENVGNLPDLMSMVKKFTK